MTQLFVAWSVDGQCALDHLTPLAYRELRRIVASYLRRERLGHGLQPTALVHEVSVRLIDQNIADCYSCVQFFALTANRKGSLFYVRC